MSGASPIEVRILREPGHEDLPDPCYATDGSAGMDLHAAVREPVTLRPGEIHLLPTALRIALPRGWEGQVRARSGLALRHGLSLVNGPGTIDSDYRGEIGVILTVLKNEPFTVTRGMRIAQLVISPVGRAELIREVRLSETERGGGGFGHTGLEARAD